MVPQVDQGGRFGGTEREGPDLAHRGTSWRRILSPGARSGPVYQTKLLKFITAAIAQAGPGVPPNQGRLL